MRKILTVAALIGIMGLPCQLSAQQTRHCLECGKSLSACPYKGNHPNCPTCGKAKDKCAYKGKHLPSQPQLVTNDKGEIVATWRCIVEPRFDDASAFSEGLAAVQVGKKIGYIDHTGKMVIEPQFSHAATFSEGLAAVRVGDWGDGKYGFIDKTGKMVIPARYEDASSFSEGLAAVELDGKFGFIDKTGKMVIPNRFTWAVSFSEGLAAVTTEGGINDVPIEISEDETWWGTSIEGKWGFIDKTGKIVITPQFEYLSLGGDYYFGYWFSEGMTCVELRYIDGDDMNGEFGYIDKTGRVIIDGYGEAFHEGLAAVNNYYIDNTGKKKISRPYFHWTKSFSEGLAAVMKDTEKWGYIDKTGNWVIQPRFDWAADFMGGFAVVRTGQEINEYVYNLGEEGIIDKYGNIIVKPQFEEIYHSKGSDGLFAVEKDGKWGFIKVSPAK